MLHGLGGEAPGHSSELPTSLGYIHLYVSPINGIVQAKKSPRSIHPARKYRCIGNLATIHSLFKEVDFSDTIPSELMSPQNEEMVSFLLSCRSLFKYIDFGYKTLKQITASENTMFKNAPTQCQYRFHTSLSRTILSTVRVHTPGV